MRLLALAMLLAVVQALSPVPRKALDSATGTSRSAQKDASGNQAPTSQSATPVNPVTTKPEQNPSNPPRSKDTEQSIRVRELPPVAVTKDWTDRAYWAFSGLLVIVGFLQAWLLYLNFRTSQPRLHVDGVRVGWFKEGQQPIFFVKIMNSGIVAAENVSISVKVEFANSTIQYNRNQVIKIPAHSRRECFICSPAVLDRAVLAGFDSGTVPLRVSGHVMWNQKTIEYCYKYYPWPFDQPRPQKLRRFVPCDFDTNITVGVEVKATMNPMTATLGTVLIKAEDGTAKPPKEPLKNERN